MPYAFNDYCYANDDLAFDAFINQSFPKFNDGNFYNFVSAIKTAGASYDVTVSKSDGVNPVTNTVQAVSFTACDPLANEQNLTDLVGFFSFGFGVVVMVALTAHGLQAVLAMIQHKKN